MPSLQSLSLNAFRNYDTAHITDLSANFVVLVGENGAGKTNCLEAISLLGPGRGLRGASVPDHQSNTNDTLWSVTSTFTDSDGDTSTIGVGRNPQKPDKKIIRYNGDTLKSQNELGQIIRTIWLTPQMDGIFLAGASERRRFFDRLVAAFDPAHSGRMTRYERATRERLNILKSSVENGVPFNTDWLTGLETIMAETAIAIAAARNDTLTALQPHIHKTSNDTFPHSAISLNGEVERWLHEGTALQAEDRHKASLQKNRHVDAQTGRTNNGVHKTDMTVIHEQKNMPANSCSTGEQKGLLTNIILAHADMVRKKYGQPPILLFDEIAAHFDEKRRAALYAILSDLGGQVWLTGQDLSMFNSLTAKTTISIQNNEFTPL